MISRADARVQGLTHYNTGKQCKHGHYGERFTSTGNCVECTKQRDTPQRVPPRPGTVVLRGVVVPRQYAREIVAIIQMYMRAAGLVPTATQDAVAERRWARERRPQGSDE